MAGEGTGSGITQARAGSLTLPFTRCNFGQVANTSVPRFLICKRGHYGSLFISLCLEKLG